MELVVSSEVIKNSFNMKKYDISPSLTTMDTIKLFCARDFLLTKKNTQLTFNSRFILIKEDKSNLDIDVKEYKDFSFNIEKEAKIKYIITYAEDPSFKNEDILLLDINEIDKQYLIVKKIIPAADFKSLSSIKETLNIKIDNKMYELLFNKPVDTNRDYDIQKFSELIQKKHQELQQEKEQEKILYGKIRTLNDLIYEKHNFKIYKYDTHLNLSFKLQSSLDIYEIFNKFKPSIRLPFFHAKDFNKCLNNFILREDWVKNLIEDEIYFYVKISDYQENYAKCIFSDVKYENQTYYFDLDIQIEKSYFETLNQRLDLFVEVVKYLPDFLITNEVEYKERVHKGYMYISLNDFKFIDIPILQHYFSVDDVASFVLSIDERSSVFKIRGGLATHLHLYKTDMKEKYNFDGKLNWIYDKIGKLSKTKLNLLNVQERDENEYDVLIIKYKKLKIEYLESLLIGILNYVSKEQNIEQIKKLYNSYL